jgi:hypothetical protein
MRRIGVMMLILVSVATLFGCRGGQVTTITEREVVEAQKTWGEGIVEIGKAYTGKGDYRAAAERHIDELYGYGSGEVLFKPTKAADQQFRFTKQGALSYFVGGDSDFPEDKGFATSSFTNVRFDNKGTLIEGKTALAMGNYYFTTPEGEEVKVEYSFGYKKDDAGKLRIVLHHSSVPYKP